jgi:DHA1 family bicyclomycin/chloramphenicol resistance-like MFS transporter
MSRLGFVLTLGALAAVSATAIDIGLPAQPEIGRTLGASPEAGAALVSGYLLGYGPGQLIWGPLSDRFGRIGLLYLSVIGFILTSLACAFAGSLDVLFAMRFVQGITGGGAPAIARAIARDQGGGRETAALISSMTIIIGGAPLLAPLIGSGLLAIADWRWIFGFLALFGCVLIAGIACFLGQRKRRDRRDWVSARVYAGTALHLLREPEFLLGIGIAASVFAGYASVLGAGAVIAQGRYGVSPEAFGPVFSIAAFSFVIGSSAARRILRNRPLDRAVSVGAMVVAAAGIGLGVAYFIDLPLVPFWGLVCLYTAAFGMLMPTGTAMALEPAGAVAGLASSIVGTGPTLIGALSSMLVVSGLFGDSYESLCLITAASAAIIVLLVLASLKVRGAPAEAND